MPNYINPASGLFPGEVPYSGFASGYNQAQNANIMAPFQQQALQEGDLALQSARAQFGEEQDPVAIANRMALQKQQLGERQSAINEQGILGQIVHQKHLNEFDNMPIQQQQQIEKDTQELQRLRTQPERDQHAALAELAPLVDRAAQPDQFGNQNQVRTYERGIQEIQRRYPNVPIPDEFKQYSPEGEKWLQDHFYAQAHSAAQAAKMETTIAGHQTAQAADIRGQYGVEEAKIRAGAETGAAQIRANVEKPLHPDVQAKLDEITLNSPVKLSAWAQKNGVDEDTAKVLLKQQIQSTKEDKLKSDAAKRADSQAASSIALPAGHPDKNLTWEQRYQNTLNTMSGSKPDAAGAKEIARPGEKIMVDKNGNKAVQRMGKWIEVQ